MSPRNYLRLGLIFAITGVLALVHRFTATTHVFSSGVELVVAIVLILIGIPLLVFAARH